MTYYIYPMYMLWYCATVLCMVPMVTEIVKTLLFNIIFCLIQYYLGENNCFIAILKSLAYYSVYIVSHIMLDNLNTRNFIKCLYLTFAVFILFRLFLEQNKILLHLSLYISHVLINLSIRCHVG